MKGRPLLLAALSVFLVIALAAVTFGTLARAFDAQPGSEDDPLVSRSYVDRYVKFSVVNLSAGQSLISSAPGVEVIVRAGKATAIGTDAGGVADLTAGLDLKTGREIALNHLMMLPRADGRGVYARTDLVLMVRGPYEVK